MRTIPKENEEPNKEEEEMELEFVDNEEIDEPTTKEDKRLKKSIKLLIKITKIDEENLKGLSLEEQFDRLSFLQDNMPKKKKSKNKPVVPLPIDLDMPKFGKKVKNSAGGHFWLFSPKEWLKPKIKK